jgi:hypothetical protein
MVASDSVTLRLPAGGSMHPYVIEINALPGLAPISDLVLCAQAEGWTYADLLNAVLAAGLRRYGLVPLPGRAAERVLRASSCSVSLDTSARP